MTESDIKISTFCTNIFRQFCYVSFSAFLNYLTIWFKKKKKKKKQSRRKALKAFSEHGGISFHRMRQTGPTENSNCREQFLFAGD